jgi:hypothetical protein
LSCHYLQQHNIRIELNINARYQGQTVNVVAGSKGGGQVFIHDSYETTIMKI